jgi:3-dehydroquinate synthase
LLPPLDARRLARIIESYGLPVRPPVEMQPMLAAMRKDKKRAGKQIHFVFLDALGSARVEEVPLDELHRLVNAVKMG